MATDKRIKVRTIVITDKTLAQVEEQAHRDYDEWKEGDQQHPKS